MTDIDDGSSTAEQDANSPGKTHTQTVLPTPHAEMGTRPVAATVVLLGVLLTGLLLVAAPQLNHSAAARVLAVVAVVTGLVAVVVALLGQMSALLTVSAEQARRAGRGSVVAVLSAGLLSLLAVLLAGAAALLAVQARPAVAAGSTEPTVAIQRAASAQGGTAVTAQLSFPGLKAGYVLDATMKSIDEDNEAGETMYVVAHGLVRAGENGPAVVQLLASVDPNDGVLIEAKSPDRSCTVTLPTAGDDDIAAARMTCTD